MPRNGVPLHHRTLLEGLVRKPCHGNNGAATVSWKGRDPAQSFVLTFTPQLNILTKTFRLVSCSNTFQILLLFLQGQGQKGKQKHITMKVVRFHNHCPFINYGCMLQKQLFRVIASLAAKERKFVPLTKPWVNEKRNLKTRSQGSSNGFKHPFYEVAVILVVMDHHVARVASSPSAPLIYLPCNTWMQSKCDCAKMYNL